MVIKQNKQKLVAFIAGLAGSLCAPNKLSIEYNNIILLP